ncbi:sugar phosphate nucleotidyltransferase [Paenibacillus vietnamensis]|uniref:sugar phosphate nucleotidyltransferase n=1 Tax=Paenibacillus vietnamensis TaxID=2590547 RepID=UPI001CD109AC|nr:sugar phosphate nucleotidyltransferase [Paenibacillus vietnamensis]
MKKHTECLAMLLAGGEGRRLAPLTDQLAKPAVPFGERLRLIDFPLNNCSHSGIRTIGVLTQYCADSIHEYINERYAPQPAHTESLQMTMLPSYLKGIGGYSGTADAIYRNIDYIDQHAPEHVLILSGDHIYQMDYRPMLDFHKKKRASATIAVKPVPWREASRFGILDTDSRQRITSFEEKPAKPSSNLASMGIYLFKWADLKRYLLEDAANDASSHDFGKDIIPAVLASRENMAAYPFKGYWRDVGTIESLWAANMDLLGGELTLDAGKWRLPGANPDVPGSEAGARLERSVVCPGVTIGRGSELSECIVMPGAQIGKNVKIHRAIIGEGAIIPDRAVIERYDGQISVVGPGEILSAAGLDEKAASAAAS